MSLLKHVFIIIIPIIAHCLHVSKQQQQGALKNLDLPDGYLAVTINKGDVKKVSILPVHADGQKAGNATAIVEGFVNPTSIGYLPQHQTLVISDPGRDEGEVLLQKLAYDQDSKIVADGGPIPLLVGKKIFSTAVDARSGDVFLGEAGKGSVLRIKSDTVEMILEHRAHVHKESDVDVVTQAQIVERALTADKEPKQLPKPEMLELYSSESSAALENNMAPHVAVTDNSKKVFITSADAILGGNVDVASESKLDVVANEPSVRNMVDTQRMLYFTEEAFVKAVSHGGFASPVVVTEKLASPQGIAFDGENTVYVVDTATPGSYESTGAIFSFPCGSEDGHGDYSPDFVTDLDGAYDVAFVPAFPKKKESLLAQVESFISFE